MDAIATGSDTCSDLCGFPDFRHNSKHLCLVVMSILFYNYIGGSVNNTISHMLISAHVKR